ncbi:hypothetical protein M513_12232 [Trichuris suis]|nr:hypothetical protein M513_12232 [Trichuris suis]
MSTVVSYINFVKSRGFNSPRFKVLLNGLDPEEGDLAYHCEVRRLSGGNMLMRLYELWDEIKQFMKIKGNPVKKLNDSKWLCYLAFMMDITKYLSELNVKLQAPTSFSTPCFQT